MIRSRRLKLFAVLLLSGCAMTPSPATPAAAPARVIVELAPAGGLTGPAAIAQAQDSVIASLPPERVRVVRRYGALPLLALEIDPALVETLRRNTAVVKVSPDETRSPAVE